MATDRMLDLVGQPGGPLADAALWGLEVIEAGSLTQSMQRLVLTAPGIEGLRYAPGQDLMLRVPLVGNRIVNRRYTIRRLDASGRTVTIDVSLHGAGPGTDWIRTAKVGDHIEAIGPRGKVTVRPEAAWHLFVVDETGLPGTLAMMEALPPGSAATAIIEVDTAADEHDPDAQHVEGLEMRWLHRLGASVPGDAARIVKAVGAADLPPGAGHVYVAAEAKVVREVNRVLAERGLGPDQVSSKAYWRRGLPNAEHGEPTREG